MTDPDQTLPALECGRDPLEVIDHARDGVPTAHEQSCPFCRAAVEADAVSRSAADELTRAQDDEDVPDSLLPNIMRSVWGELRRAEYVALRTGAGPASVADHAVAAVIERALDELTDLQIHTCKVSVGEDADSLPDDEDAVVSVQVTAAAAYSADMRAVAEQARGITRDTLARQFRWTAATIDIAIVDVYLPGSAR